MADGVSARGEGRMAAQTSVLSLVEDYGRLCLLGLGVAFCGNEPAEQRDLHPRSTC